MTEQNFKEGFFVKFRGQPYKGIVKGEASKYSNGEVLVWFESPDQDLRYNMANYAPEHISEEDLVLWHEGKIPVRVRSGCNLMYESWRGKKCDSCPYRNY